jgi:hypothetical protein
MQQLSALLILVVLAYWFLSDRPSSEVIAMRKLKQLEKVQLLMIAGVQSCDATILISSVQLWFAHYPDTLCIAYSLHGYGRHTHTCVMYWQHAQVSFKQRRHRSLL